MLGSRDYRHAREQGLEFVLYVIGDNEAQDVTFLGDQILNIYAGTPVRVTATTLMPSP